MRIDQIIPSIIEHDAVSNHTFAAQELLASMGHESEIYASVIGPGCAGRVRPLDELDGDGDQGWLLYQCSIGGPAAEVFARHGARKLLDYHNITPAPLVERWIPPLGQESRLGRAQLLDLAPMCQSAFGDSAFNADELIACGFKNVSVAPVMVEQANFEAPPDSVSFEALMEQKKAGGQDWLFVGQLAPHKAQHDVVRAFACYRRVFDPNARLHLVGREMGSSYRRALVGFIERLGLREAIDLPGSVPVAVLAAYYATADVFVCCSDHEGFCVPVIEAMSRGVPVVAFSVAAVTETVGDAGVLLSRKDPALVAAAVHALLDDGDRRDWFVAAGRAQAEHYSIERARATFVATIEQALARR